jgi:hypothetical protein
MKANKVLTSFQRKWYKEIAQGKKDNCEVTYCKHCGLSISRTR